MIKYWLSRLALPAVCLLVAMAVFTTVWASSIFDPGTKCGANLHVISLAFQQYVQDYDDQLPLMQSRSQIDAEL